MKIFFLGFFFPFSWNLQKRIQKFFFIKNEAKLNFWSTIFVVKSLTSRNYKMKILFKYIFFLSLKIVFAYVSELWASLGNKNLIWSLLREGGRGLHVVLQEMATTIIQSYYHCLYIMSGLYMRYYCHSLSYYSHV